MSNVGWGAGEWGASPWGGTLDAALLVLEAVASRENAVQIVFNHPVYLSGLGDLPDGADPSHYSVTPVPGFVGADGTEARAVTVLAAAAVSPVPAGVFPGAIVELTLDRPMTPFPSMYQVACAGLFTADLASPLDPATSTGRFSGCFKELVPPQVDAGHPMRDLANPQTQGALIAAAPQALLGSFAADGSGDYASDQGLTGYEKRILRRLVTIPGGFLHLGRNYGVGVAAAGKKLATASARAKLAADAEKQIAQEPETAVVRVTPVVDNSTPGKFLLRIFARPKVGRPTTFDVPLPVR
jgi:hypothetical protein